MGKRRGKSQQILDDEHQLAEVESLGSSVSELSLSSNRTASPIQAEDDSFSGHVEKAGDSQQSVREVAFKALVRLMQKRVIQEECFEHVEELFKCIRLGLRSTVGAEGSLAAEAYGLVFLQLGPEGEGLLYDHKNLIEAVCISLPTGTRVKVREIVVATRVTCFSCFGAQPWLVSCATLTAN